MALLFKIELWRPDENPRWIASVKPVEAGLVGVYVNGVPYAPDKAAIRDALPHYLRKAFDRAAGTDTRGGFWFDTNDRAYCKLTPSKGRGGVLATIWATPYHFEPSAC